MASRGINKVIIVGNLGQDPEVRFMPNGGAVANFTVATSETWKDKQSGEQKEKTEWHRIVMYQRLAEIAGEYLKKGSKILVEGRLVFDQWVDQNNNKRSKHSVIIESMQMLGSKDENMQNQGGNQYNNGGYNQNQQQPQYQNNYGNQNSYGNNNYSNSQGNSGYGSNGGGYSTPNQNNSYSAQNNANNNSYNKPSEPPKDMEQNKPSPKETSIPEIDIDDDQVPF